LWYTYLFTGGQRESACGSYDCIEDASLRHLIRIRAYRLPEDRTKNKHYVISPDRLQAFTDLRSAYVISARTTPTGQPTFGWRHETYGSTGSSWTRVGPGAYGPQANRLPDEPLKMLTLGPKNFRLGLTTWRRSAKLVIISGLGRQNSTS